MRLNVVACLKQYSVVFPNIFDADKYISAPSPSCKYSKLTCNYYKIIIAKVVLIFSKNNFSKISWWDE